MLPKLSFVGRLTKEPDLRYTANEKSICKITLACNQKGKDKEKTLFINCTSFHGVAESLNKAHKGHRVNVTGEIYTDTWTDAKSKEKRSAINMTIFSFDFIELRSRPMSPAARPVKNENF